MDIISANSVHNLARSVEAVAHTIKASITRGDCAQTLQWAAMELERLQGEAASLEPEIRQAEKEASAA